MDSTRSEKLAAARKKLRRFQSRNSQKPASQHLDDSTSSLAPHSMIPDSDSPSQFKNTRLSAAEGLREISQEISSILSENALDPGTHPSHSLPTVTITPSLDPSASPHHVRGYNLSPTVTPHSHLSSEPSALEKQLQAHKQTIDVLVEEKTALQSKLSAVQLQLQNKTRECSDMTSHLHSTRLKMEEIEREKFNLAEELTRKEKTLSQCVREGNDLREGVERWRSASEDQQEENTELVSKITAQATEIQALQSSCTDLQSKLNMAELLTHQLSGGAPSAPSPAPSSQLLELQEELQKVQRNVQRTAAERDQALSDLAALRDSLMQQQEDNARRLAGFQERLAEGKVQVTSLSQELASLQQERDSLMEQLSTERAQLRQSGKVAMETVQQERDDLQKYLQQQVQDNAQLTRLNAAQEGRVCELEAELSRLREEAIDQQSLLTTIAQDKETISRAVSQNKELKSNLTELQDAFVQMSQQNMEQASALETERHTVGELQRLLGEVERSRDRHVEGERGEPPLLARDGKESVESEQLQATAADSKESAEREQLQVPVTATDKESEQLQAVVLERDSLMGQLRELQLTHSELVCEHERVLQGRRETPESMEGEEEAAGDFIGLEVDIHSMSATELTTLQKNFSALQQRFMALMGEKADLLDQLQEQENVIVRLSGETETIGEYIALYQLQREALRGKFQEKDRFIQQLIAEKTTIQVKLQGLQVLMRQLLEERHQPSPPPTRTHPPSSTPPHSPTIPLHLRPQAYGSSFHTSSTLAEATFEQKEEGVADNTLDSHVTTGTAEQIMNLLDQLEAHGGIAMETMVPCTCCTGELITV